MKLPEKYSAARKALAAAVRIDEVKSIRDKAVAMQVYAAQAKDTQLIDQATEIRMRAERRLGEIMIDDRKAGKLAKGARGLGRPKKGGSPKDPPKKERTLADQGIDKHLADRARKAAATPEDKFEAQVEKAKKRAVASVEGDKAIIKEARREQQKEKKVKRTKRERELADKIIALPDKRYGVILADPEWAFETWSEETGMDRAAANHYSTSATEVIKSRPVETIAADDCILFLWATNPMLTQALEVMKAWDFTYKSNVAWVKDTAGTGYWFRERHEILLIGTRGKVPCPAQGDQWESVLERPRGKKHSEKPEDFLYIINGYFPNLPKIELNCRGKPIEGWDAWGLEADVAEAAE